MSKKWYEPKYAIIFDVFNEKWKQGFIKNRIEDGFKDNAYFIDDQNSREHNGQLQIYRISGGKKDYLINRSEKVPDISNICIMHKSRMLRERIKEDFQKRTRFKLMGGRQ